MNLPIVIIKLVLLAVGSCSAFSFNCGSVSLNTLDEVFDAVVDESNRLGEAITDFGCSNNPGVSGTIPTSPVHRFFKMSCLYINFVNSTFICV